MKPIFVPLEELWIDEDSALVHYEHNIHAIVKSLREFGQVTPIVVTAAKQIAKGNATLLAARIVGLDGLWCVQLPGNLSAVQIRRFNIADNRAAQLAEWDWEILAMHLKYLHEHGGAAGIGFSPAEVQPLLEAKFVPDVPREGALEKELGQCGLLYESGEDKDVPDMEAGLFGDAASVAKDNSVLPQQEQES